MGLFVKKLGGMFCEDNGKVSYSRVVAFMIVAVYLVFASYMVFETKKMPDMPSGVAALVGVFYAANKIASVLQRNGKNGE